MTLTKKQIKVLKDNEQHLNTAGKANYIRGMYTSSVVALFDLYKELFQDNPGNISCGNCRLKVCKKLYNVYKNICNNNE